MQTDLVAFDQAQRKQALDIRHSFIVQAPAGSGKTELIIQRLLSLLINVNRPEEILAITFTKKAANEMRARVIKALKHADIHPEPESAHEKLTWQLAKRVLQRDHELQWHLINNPNQLRIQTIDSLCTYLTAQLPLLSHFGSQPDITDYPVVLYRLAVQEVLSHVEENVAWSQAIATLLLHLDNDLNKLHDLLVSLLSKRDQWLAHIHLDVNEDNIRRKLEYDLGQVISDHLLDLKQAFPTDIIPTLMEIARYTSDQLAIQNQSSALLACRDLQTLPACEPQYLQAWKGLAQLLLTKSGTWRKKVDASIGFTPVKDIKCKIELAENRAHQETLKKIISSLSGNENLQQKLADLFFLPEARYNDAQWETLKSLFLVLKIAAAQLRIIFQRFGQIDFIENAQAALSALGTDDAPTDFALTLDYQIRHILVDEFQDTSYSQYQLLEKLIAGWMPDDGRTLFVVGDPMQSIYRFREADVGLFMRMCKSGIGLITLIPLALAVNFRSTATIVQWNNEHFQRIFPVFNDIATGAVTYSHSTAQHTQDDVAKQSCVQIERCLNVSELSEGNHIVRIIEETKALYPQDKIAILVRSRSHLVTILPILKQANIPFQAIDIEPLATHQCIQDLLSLTCALLHPADRLSWLATLRAPWCGLTLADLLAIAGGNPHASIWEQLENQRILQQVSEQGQVRLKKLLPVLQHAIAERERQDVRAWIESTWMLLGGPACLQNYSDMENVHAYFKLLEAISKDNGMIQPDQLKEMIDTLFASGHDDDNSVQIMTIHAAKGLEFDTVIMPQLNRKIPNDDKSLLLWMERPLANEQDALLLAPMHATGNDTDAIYEYINRQRRVKSAHETIRLFYVATTRAKKRLHLLYTVKDDSDDETSANTGSFLDKLSPFLIVENPVTEQIPLLSENMPASHQASHELCRINIHWQNPFVQISQSSAKHQQQHGFQLADTTPRIIGIVIHRIMQLLAENGMEWWKHGKHAQQLEYIKQQLLQAGCSPALLAESAAATRQAVMNAMSDDRGQWILRPHSEAQSEFALTAVINGIAERHIIDRTFIDEKGVRWIIDYKTSTLHHDALSDFLKHEQKKYMEKMQNYYHAIRLNDDRPVRLGLYFPALPTWKEWEPADE